MATPSTFYQKKNNAKSTITNNPLAAGGLSITLASSTGALFPTTGATWLATIWDAVTYADPSDDSNMEVVLIDSRSTDTLTVNASGRGFAGTTGVSHPTGSAIRLLIMKEHMTQHETAITNLEAWADPTGASSGTQVLGYAEATAAQAGITTEVDLTSLSVAVTVPAGGRRVRITGWIPTVSADTNGMNLLLRIKESTTQLNIGTWHATTGAGSVVNSLSVSHVFAPSAGAHTYKLTLQASAGNTATDAAATYPAYILVELI